MLMPWLCHTVGNLIISIALNLHRHLDDKKKKSEKRGIGVEELLELLILIPNTLPV
jgi:hypothetical protein